MTEEKISETIAKSNRPETDEERLRRLKQEEETEKKKAEVAKHSPFKKFLQVNDESYKEEAWLMRKNPVAYQVLRFLTHHMDNFNAIICSYKVFEEALDYKRTTLSLAIKFLKEHKYIDIAKTGTTNVYMINKQLYWKSYGTNYRYAEFGAKIILSSSEQDKAMQAEIEMMKTPILQTSHEKEIDNKSSLILSDFSVDGGKQNELHEGANEAGTDNGLIQVFNE